MFIVILTHQQDKQHLLFNGILQHRNHQHFIITVALFNA